MAGNAEFEPSLIDLETGEPTDETSFIIPNDLPIVPVEASAQDIATIDTFFEGFIKAAEELRQKQGQPRKI